VPAESCFVVVAADATIKRWEKIRNGNIIPVPVFRQNSVVTSEIPLLQYRNWDLKNSNRRNSILN